MFVGSPDPVPAQLRTKEFLLRPIVEADTERDYVAVMDTREALRLWRMSTWPEDEFTVEENRVDARRPFERRAACDRSRAARHRHGFEGPVRALSRGRARARARRGDLGLLL